MKKIILLILLLAAMAASCGLIAHAEEGFITVRWEDNLFPQPQPQLMSTDGNDKNKELYNVISGGIKNRETKIDISSFNIPADGFKDRFSNLFYDIVYENPECFYVATGYGYSYNPETNTVTSIAPMYLDITDEMTDAANKSVDNAIKAYIFPEMSDAEKALALHNYLISTVEYDSEAAASNTITGHEHSYTAYGALVNKKGVCQSYTLAYGWLLNKCGIKWDTVTSASMNHAWNEVELDGNWYHVDATWDDGKYSNGEHFYRCDYFLKSDDQYRQMGHIKLEDWVRGYPCNGGKYGTEDWSYRKTARDTSIMKYSNGKYYYNSINYVKDTSELPEGISEYYTNSNSNKDVYPYYYKHYAVSDFNGGNFALCTAEDYNAVAYPFTAPVSTPVITAVMTAPNGIEKPTTAKAALVAVNGEEMSETEEDVDTENVQTVYIKLDNVINRKAKPTVKTSDGSTYTPIKAYELNSNGYFIYQFGGINLTGARVLYDGAAETPVTNN